MSCSHCQEWWQQAWLAPNWLHKSEQPIRSHASKLTQPLTMTQTQKFLLQRYLHHALPGLGRLHGGGAAHHLRLRLPHRRVEQKVVHVLRLCLQLHHAAPLHLILLHPGTQFIGKMS